MKPPRPGPSGFTKKAAQPQAGPSGCRKKATPPQAGPSGCQKNVKPPKSATDFPIPTLRPRSKRQQGKTTLFVSF